MSVEFKKYESMKRNGSSAVEVFLEAVRDRIDPITQIKLIREVFSLTIRDAKEVIVRAEGAAESLDQFQQDVAEQLEALDTKKEKGTGKKEKGTGPFKIG